MGRFESELHEVSVDCPCYTAQILGYYYLTIGNKCPIGAIMTSQRHKYEFVTRESDNSILTATQAASQFIQKPLMSPKE